MILKAFESDTPFNIDVDARMKSRGVFEVEWSVNGPLPALVASPLKGRADRLWLDTVFEVFGGFSDAEAYWETNLSPHGHWNSYSFNSYRQGMLQTESVVVSDLEWITKKERQWRFVSRYHFEAQDGPLSLGLACIMHPGPYHFALMHSGPKPDFHVRESFVLSL